MGDTRRRALVAALLGALGAVIGIAGVGHAYLREWRRAIAWFTFVVGAGVFLVSLFADLTRVTVNSLPVVVLGPIFALLTLSIFDAYYLGRREPMKTAGSDAVRCPYCRGELDPTLDFCHWCTNPLGADSRN